MINDVSSGLDCVAGNGELFSCCYNSLVPSFRCLVGIFLFPSFLRKKGRFLKLKCCDIFLLREDVDVFGFLSHRGS